MRVNTLLAMLMLAFVALSGCTDDGDAGHDDECADAEDHDACHSGNDDGNGDGNETDLPDDNETAVPNMIPKVMLTASADGIMLNESTYVVAGTMVTFSANGTEDVDGVIDIAALTVIDRNQSRTVELLPGESVTMLADTAGPLLASYRVLDEDGGSNATTVLTYVNEVQVLTGSEDAGAPSGVTVTNCEGPTSGQGTLLDDAYSTQEGIQLKNGTKWVEAWVVGGSVDIAICDGDQNNIGTNGGAKHRWSDEFDVPNSVNHYVYVVCKSASGCGSWEVHVINHWEGQPAEVAAKP